MPSLFVMKTDHGTHSADTWADMISQMLFPISEDIAQHKLLVAKRTQVAIAEALSSHVDNCLDCERTHLSNDADARFNADHDGHRYVDEAVAKIHAVTDKTEWADHMHEVEPTLRQELLSHFDHMQSVERMHHHDHNPSEAGCQYKAQFHA